MAENVVFLIFLLLPCLCAAGAWLFFKTFRQPQSTRPRLLTLLAGNVLIFLTLATALLPIGEVYFRWFYDATDSFSLTKTSERWFQRHYHENESGFRDSVERYSTVREPGKKRLVILGDSFAEGHGVADVENRFANLLRQRLPDWEIQVRARSGWDTWHELEAVENMPRHAFETDAVLLAYGLNDIAPCVPEWQSILKSIYVENQPGFFIQNSYLLSVLYYRFYWLFHPQADRYYEFVSDAYGGPAWEEQAKMLKEIEQIVQTKLHAQLLVVTLPFLDSLGEDYAFQSAHDRLNQFWSAQQVPHLDLLPIFKGLHSADVTVNRFDAHPNERAHALMADSLAEFLQENLP